MFDENNNGFFEDLKVNELFTTGSVPGVRFRRDANNMATCLEDGSKSQAFHGRAAVTKIAKAPAPQASIAGRENPPMKTGRSKPPKVTAQDEGAGDVPAATSDSAPADSVSQSNDPAATDPTAPSDDSL